MSQQNIRYQRQELVIGKKTQKQLEKAKVTIVGLGALGTVAAELLARAGIGSLTIVDRDLIELTNLQRQTLYTEEDINKPKAEIAYTRLKKINSKIKIKQVMDDLNHKNINNLIKNQDLILDCTDNLYTRFLINEFARKNNIPWIYAGAIKDHGNVMAITKNTPCFRCTFQEAQGLDTCDTAGVLNTITTTIAALQVNEAIKLLTKGVKEQQLIHLNINNLQLTTIKTRKNKDCPVCNKKYSYLEGKKEQKTVKFCGSDTFQFFVDKIDLKKLKNKLKKIDKVKGNNHYLFFKNLSIFKNGRIVVKAKNIQNARATIAKYIGN